MKCDILDNTSSVYTVVSLIMTSVRYRNDYFDKLVSLTARNLKLCNNLYLILPYDEANKGGIDKNEFIIYI